MNTIVISDIPIDVTRKKIKNIHLAVYPPDGNVRISAPEDMTDEAIRLFAVSRLGWIKRNQRGLRDKYRISELEYVNRESHYLFGERYLLNVIEHDAPPKVVIRNKTYIDLYVRPGSTAQKREQVMTEWYRKHLKEVIPGYITKWEKRIGQRINEWQVKKMRTKWGTCNRAERRIWLNLELVHKPPICLEYIIVHEILHLIERHHNERFIFLLDTFLPDWKKRKHTLNSLPLGHENWTY